MESDVVSQPVIMSTLVGCDDSRHALKQQYERIDLTLKKCQAHALENSPSMIDSMQNLYNLLNEIKPIAVQSDLDGKKLGSYLRHVAKDLIQMNYVVMLIDDEIEGVMREILCTDFEWYLKALGHFEQARVECDKNEETMKEPNRNNDNLSSWNIERFIDRCLDLCGYGISLEAAVDCLRGIVHNSSDSSQEEDFAGIAPIVTSLRTIRRYLLHVPSLYQEGCAECCPIIFQLKLLGKDATTYLSKTKSIWNCCILSLEYHCKSLREKSAEMESMPILGDSLTEFTSILPSLVATACHAKNLALPWWSSPKSIHSLLLQAAWKTLLIGELVGSQGEDTSDFRRYTSQHFQSLARQMLQKGQSSIVAKVFYNMWRTCGIENVATQISNTPPRSMLSSQCRTLIESISSTRVIANFYRDMIRCSAKYCFSEDAHCDDFDMKYKQDVLPFLRDTTLSVLIVNEDVRDAIVNVVILSPPSSFFQHFTSPTGYPSLSCLDRAIPRYTSLLLYLATGKNQRNDNKKDTECDSESDNRNMFLGTYLSHLCTVASIWSEDTFVSRTDALQQQYVTEFLLYPLQQEHVSMEEFQGGSLATTLVQGITLRLDANLSQNIRVDGMRIAEAMATMLGQQLQFVELHSASESTEEAKKDESEINSKIKNAKSRNGKRRKKPDKRGVLDPDAEYFSYGSDSSSSLSEHSNESCMYSSAEDEDSLKAYSLDDDEEDLRRVPIPRRLQECYAYLIAPDSDNLAPDKHKAALTELARIVESKPFDLVDMTSTLVRVLLHLEDKFGWSMFANRKWECLLALGVHAPLDTCVQLVTEIRGGVALGTRLEALSILASAAEFLSISPSTAENPETVRLKISPGLRQETGVGINGQTSLSKTRRRRSLRVDPRTTANNFGPIAAHVMYSLFALMANTKENSSIWGGPTGERFLSEFIKTLAVMLDCASSYPSHAVSAIASDLFELAWSFHDANSVAVRRAVLLAMATCVRIMPIDIVTRNSKRWVKFLKDSMCDSDEECRKLSRILLGPIAVNTFIE